MTTEPSTEQFDFWCGRWSAATVDDGSALTGTNEVDWLWDRTVLREQFSLPQPDGTVYRGTSLSVPVPGRGWCQTWVDSAGGYLDFVGGWDGSRMVLERTAARAGVSVRQRMTWRDIGPDAFQWDWESSTDDGRSWRVDWHIDYARQA